MDVLRASSNAQPRRGLPTVSSSPIVASDANQFLDVAIVHSATRHGTARQTGSIHEGPLVDQLRAADHSDSHVVTDSVRPQRPQHADRHEHRDGPAAEAERVGPRHAVRAVSDAAVQPPLVERIDDHQHREQRPEQHVVPGERNAPESRTTGTSAAPT